MSSSGQAAAPKPGALSSTKPFPEAAQWRHFLLVCSRSDFPVTLCRSCSYFLVYLSSADQFAVLMLLLPHHSLGKCVRKQAREPAGSAPPWLLLQAPARIPALPSLGYRLCVTPSVSPASPPLPKLRLVLVWPQPQEGVEKYKGW